MYRMCVVYVLYVAYILCYNGGEEDEHANNPECD